GHDTRAIQDYLGHRRSRRPCATPPSRRTLQGVLAGLRGLPGARTKKAHVGRNCTVSAADVGAWDGAVAVQQVLFPGHSLAGAEGCLEPSCADVVEQAGILDGDDGLLRGVYVCVRTLRIASCFQTKFYTVPEGGCDEISLRRVTERLCV